MKTTLQELIDEIVGHLTYDDDLTDESRATLEAVRIICIKKLEKEKNQLVDFFEKGCYHPKPIINTLIEGEKLYERIYNEENTNGKKISINTGN